MAEITLNAVSKRYGPTTAVDGIDLKIATGEFLVILGPSGCGKSTLLRMIAGLEEITDGAVAIDGAVVNDVEPGARGCAMVFQNYALYPHMSVAANIGYGLKVAGVPKAERMARVTETARVLELDALLDRKPAQLSGGQRQRVAMGRAMIREPKVFLFDEPLSNLDAKLRVQMRIEIKRLHRRLGTTSVFVTHDQLEAMTMADRLVVMNGGRIEQTGTPQEIFRRPATRFVAGFIGTPAMNMIEGRIAPDGTLETVGRWRPCPGTVWDLPPGTDVTLGIRPAALSLAPSSTQAPDFTTDLHEDVGTETYLHARGDSFDLTLSLPPGTPLPRGPFGVNFAARDAHVFDTATGLRAEPRLIREPQEKGAAKWPETSLSSI